MMLTAFGFAAALAAHASATFPNCDTTRSTQTIALVHVSDLHAHYTPGADGISPYARIRGYYEAARDTNPYTLFLNSGDDHEKGSLAGHLSKGLATRDLTREMRFDIRVLGNHDFAWGEIGALDHARDPHSIVLASNVWYTGHDPLGFGATDYIELPVGCVTLGFVGPITMPWNSKDQPYAGRYPGFKARYNHIAQIKRVLKKRRNADAIIVLSHLGREDDLAIAKAIKGIDLVLGGHTHGWTWTPLTVNQATVIESGHDAQFVTRVDLDFNIKTRRISALRHDLLRVNADMPADVRMQSAVERAQARWAPDSTKKFSCACRDADARSAADVAASAALAELKVDAAFIEIKNVWTPWRAGPLTKQDLYDAFKVERQPPGTAGFSSFYITTVSGKILRDMQSGADDKHWVYRGPKAPRPDRRYRIALPKRAALNPESVLDVKSPFATPRLAGEIVDVLSAYALRRRQANLCVDDTCSAGSQ